MRIVISTVMMMLLVLPFFISAEQLLPSEQLIQSLLAANPDINGSEHMFLVWRGFDIKSKNQFDLVLLNRSGKVYAITKSEILAKAFKRKKRRSWDLTKLETGETILMFDKPEGSIESVLAKRFDIRIVSKSTMVAT